MLLDLDGRQVLRPVSVHVGSTFSYDRSRKSLTVRTFPDEAGIDHIWEDVRKLNPCSSITITGGNGFEEVYNGYNLLSSLSLRQVTPSEEPNISEPAFLVELVLVGETEDEKEVRELRDFIEAHGLSYPKKEI